MGSRIAEARRAAGLTQRDLAKHIGRDRWSVARLEKGERNVSAFELAQIAEALGTTPAHLLGRSTHVASMAVAHRVDAAVVPEHLRAAQARARRFFELDALLDQIGEPDRRGSPRPELAPPTAGGPGHQGQRLAEALRDHLGLGDRPLPDLTGLAELRLGVDVALEPMPSDVAGLCVVVGGRALAMANSSVPQGRQRFTVAHEIGHILCGDPQEVRAECDLDTSTAPEEARASAFARHLLLPVAAAHRELAERPTDRDVLRVMYAYGISLRALLIQLRDTNLLDQEQVARLQSTGPGQLSYLNGFRSDWTAAYRTCVDVRRPPARLEARVLQAYRAGRMGIGPVADLLVTEDAEALRGQLADEGIRPPVFQSDRTLLA